MITEDKDLLLKDLCVRLPYGVKMNHIANDEHSPSILIGIVKDMITLEGCGGYESTDVEDFKPYLFPMSSMTEEQKRDYQYITERWMYDAKYSIGDSIDWLNANYFDYRGLIEKGLAIDATGLKIY